MCQRTPLPPPPRLRRFASEHLRSGRQRGDLNSDMKRTGPRRARAVQPSDRRGGLVFCWGMAGIDPETGAVAEGIEAQTDQALREPRRCAQRRWLLDGRRGQDDDLLRQRRGLRPAQRGVRAAHARSTAGAVRAGARAAPAWPTDLDRCDRRPSRSSSLPLNAKPVTSTNCASHAGSLTGRSGDQNLLGLVLWSVRASSR
jgi:hypothetical protein